jgi:hypothetical protein
MEKREMERGEEREREGGRQWKNRQKHTVQEGARDLGEGVCTQPVPETWSPMIRDEDAKAPTPLSSHDSDDMETQRQNWRKVV